MAGKNEVQLGISVETQKALQDISNFKQSAVTSFKALGAAAVAVGAAMAGALAFKETIAAAQRQEDALQSVATAMGRLGEFSQEALADMSAFASELQNVTGVGDEATLEMVALAKSFGASNDQAKLMTEAAIELAAATGKSASEAIQQVSKTLGGFAGELGEVNPAIKELTAEQLKNGAAAKILIDTYGGTAASKLQTFSGAVGAMQGRFGDFLETIGDLVIKNPVVVKVIGLIGDGFNKLGAYLATNRDSIISFINKGLISIIKVIPKAIGYIADLGQVFKFLNDVVLFSAQGIVDFLKVFAGFDFVQQVVADVQDAFKFMGLEIVKVIEFMVNSGLGKFALEQFGVNVESVTQSVTEFRKEVEQSAYKPSSGDGLENFLEGVSNGLLQASNANQTFFDGMTESLRSTAEDAEDLVVTLDELSKKKIMPTIAANVTGGSKSEEKSAWKEIAAQFATAAANAFTKEDAKEGAKDLIKGGTQVGLAAFDVAGPFAAAIGAVLTLLMTDGAADLIVGIVRAIPEIVEALAYNMPLVAIALAEVLLEPFFLIRIVNAFVDGFTKGLDKGWQQAIPTMQENLGRVASHLTEALGEGIRAFQEGFTYEINNIVYKFKAGWANIRDAILEPFLMIGEVIDDVGRRLEELADSLSFSSGGSNPGGYVGQIFRGEAFAEGGVVPAGFPNDTFAARLTSGEMVVPRDDTERLSSFLDRVDTIEGILINIAGAVASPMAVQSSVQLDGRAFADIMLELSRRNARTA